MNKFIRKLLFVLFGCSSLLLSGCFFNNQPTAKLNLNECTMSVGNKKQLSISQVIDGSNIISSTNYSYIWTSSDTNVVKVSTSGLVEAIDAGTADVFANIKLSNRTSLVKAKCTFIITDPNPITISISKTESVIQQGKTLSLNATVKHTAYKQVIWSSDNPEIIVDQTGFVKASNDAEVGSSATITVTSVFDSSKKATCILNVIRAVPSSLDYTIMLYMSGSTLEYDPYNYYPYIGLFSEDIEEILSVDYPDSVRVIIETGGTKKWSLSSSKISGATSISSTKLQRWEVVNHKIQLIETLDSNSIYAEQSFESFLKWGLSSYDATQMGVIISGHGSGIGGCAVDDNNSYKCLSIENIMNASSSALADNGRDKFTWLGFDCCLMECADIASMASDYYEYMVASQESEIGQGWDHDVYLSELAKNTTINPNTLLSLISSSFVKQFHRSSETEYCMQTMSALDLSKMPAFINEFNSYIQNIGYDKNAYTNYYSKAFKSSLNSFGEACYGLVDFKDYLSNLAIYNSSVSNEGVLNALDELVIANNYCDKYSTKPCGLNAFFPESANSKQELQVEKSDYSGSVSKFTNYQNMCLEYGNFYKGW